MMKSLLLLICCIALISCGKKTTTTNPDNYSTIVYNYTNMVYVGTTTAHFEDNVNSQLTTWDTTYTDTLKVKVDSAKDRVVFTVNEGNPVGVYPQFEYPFAISSNYYRKNFIQNYYQSFYYEGDTLKSYFFRLQVGANVSYQKEIRFAGYKLP